jgi:orotidine-5'-phosphate decarboxylase
LVAIDRADLGEAKAEVQRLSGLVGGIKLGLEFFVANGPEGVAQIGSGLPLFLDLKLHDIPTTVAGAVRAACRASPRFVTLHAGGGSAMLRAAVDAVRNEGATARPRLLAVTLTSLDESDLSAVGQRGPLGRQVQRLAELAQAAGVDGVVCSPREVTALRRQCGNDFLLVVPGIRPGWASAQDQKRVMTPAEAVNAGADYLVIGRPITAATDPAAAVTRIAEEIGNQ